MEVQYPKVKIRAECHPLTNSYPLCLVSPPFPLALRRPVHYAGDMDDTGWALLMIAAGAGLAELGRRWYRRRVAARLADKLLRDVVKGKDAFRR